MKRLFLALFACVGLAAPASAAQIAMEPQNRVHAGLSLAGSGVSPGVAAGLDSRMTRLLSVDAGGFLTATAPTEEATEDVAEGIQLRHGLYVAPGLRLPHRYGEGFNWDVVARGGFGAVWSSDASNDNLLTTDPALLAGLDVVLRYKQAGMRISGKGFGYRPFTTGLRDEVNLIRPMVAVEGFYQW